MNATYLSNLTPLRGIAALLTVIYHVDLFLGNGANVLIRMEDSMALSRMYLMVDFFFILSGFIMCHVYGKWFEESVNSATFKKFTIARFARVYPLHLATLLFTIVLFYISAQLGIPKNPVLQVENTGYSIVTNLLLLHSMNLHHWFSWVHASWSISTEWWAYMIFPFLVRPLMKLNALGRVMVVLLCFAGYVSIMFFFVPLVTLPPELSFFVPPAGYPKDSLNVAFQFGFLRCLFGFVLGMMMYRGFEMNWGKKVLGNGYTMLILTLGLFLSLHFAMADVITVSFFPFLLLSGAYGSKAIDRIFTNKALQRLGDWSFSIYLVHQPLLYLITNILIYTQVTNLEAPVKPDPLTSWIICIVFIALTLLVSFLTYRFLEVPARQWINRKPKTLNDSALTS
ncbi:MAG TPA: acyltransferase [Haliscomenobacter sp.]|uniref:acyltransferase family protein n=1 Tax=Haliscomenobacter sp. TaxID=2717303 RepID=UPI002C91D96E|nr:acyltransferase [Haliscomenobacter sp.]HOY18622.1 acyltransferase [Haliscomenobacter sp.]